MTTTSDTPSPAGRRAGAATTVRERIPGTPPRSPSPKITAGNLLSPREFSALDMVLAPSPPADLARLEWLRYLTWQAISGLFGSCTHSGPGVNRRPVKIVPAVGVNAAPARASWDQAEGDPMVGTVRHHFRCAATPTSATAGTQLPTTQPDREDNAQ